MSENITDASKLAAGLTEKVLHSALTEREAEKQVCDNIDKWSAMSFSFIAMPLSFVKFFKFCKSHLGFVSGNVLLWRTIFNTGSEILSWWGEEELLILYSSLDVV